MSVCECGRCGRVFTGIRALDTHLDVDYKRPHAEVVRCQDPASLGMVRDRHDRWQLPSRPGNPNPWAKRAHVA